MFFGFCSCLFSSVGSLFLSCFWLWLGLPGLLSRRRRRSLVVRWLLRRLGLVASRCCLGFRVCSTRVVVGVRCLGRRCRLGWGVSVGWGFSSSWFLGASAPIFLFTYFIKIMSLPTYSHVESAAIDFGAKSVAPDKGPLLGSSVAMCKFHSPEEAIKFAKSFNTEPVTRGSKIVIIKVW